MKNIRCNRPSLLSLYKCTEYTVQVFIFKYEKTENEKNFTKWNELNWTEWIWGDKEKKKERERKWKTQQKFYAIILCCTVYAILFQRIFSLILYVMKNEKPHFSAPVDLRRTFFFFNGYIVVRCESKRRVNKLPDACAQA